MLSPVMVILISLGLSAILFLLSNDTLHPRIVAVIFYSLFLYWIVALKFNVSRFLKNRQSM